MNSTLGSVVPLAMFLFYDLTKDVDIKEQRTFILHATYSEAEKSKYQFCFFTGGKLQKTDKEGGISRDKDGKSCSHDVPLPHQVGRQRMILYDKIQQSVLVDWS